jgi:EcoEI R protein C-terminal.
VANAESKIYTNLDANQKEFIDFVLTKYVEAGVDELDINRLSDLVVLKYKSLHDGQKVLGDADKIKNTFIDFQKYLY